LSINAASRLLAEVMAWKAPASRQPPALTAAHPPSMRAKGSAAATVTLADAVGVGQAEAPACGRRLGSAREQAGEQQRGGQRGEERNESVSGVGGHPQPSTPARPCSAPVQTTGRLYELP
jgi:hypothetical protein